MSVAISTLIVNDLEAVCRRLLQGAAQRGGGGRILLHFFGSPDPFFHAAK